MWTLADLKLVSQQKKHIAVGGWGRVKILLLHHREIRPAEEVPSVLVDR